MEELTLRQLSDLEQIRQLKARYCRLLDEQEWAAWRTVFAEDCVLESPVGSESGTEVHGRDAIIAFLRKQIMGRRTCHHCVAPEIEFTGPQTAEATWAASFTQVGGRRGYGVYRDRYRRQDGMWVIERYRYDALWVEEGATSG